MKKKIMSVIMSIVMLFGMAFSFAGCQNEIIETEITNMIELHTWYFTSGIPNNAIVVKNTNENAIFECSADQGMLWEGNQYKNQISIKPNDTFYWHPNQEENIEYTFIDILAKVDCNVVGYAIIEVTQNGSSAEYKAEILKSVFVEKKSAKKITEKEIRTRIEEVKQERMKNKE